MISPDTYNSFIMSELKVQSEWMVNPLYHLDGTEQIRRLDALLPIAKLKVIQWTCVEGQPSPLQYISVINDDSGDREMPVDVD